MEFLFECNADRKIRPISRLVILYANVTTCVRIAFNAFEMGFFYFGTGGYPTNGTLTNSQKEKIDSMHMCQHNPFVHYNVKKERNHFKLRKKNERVNCEMCKTKAANAKCSFKLCLKCCIEYARKLKV